MNAFSDFNGLINYIEDNLFGEIDVLTLAKKAKLSVYEFRRIFSFVVGTPICEYIRKRRLSACVEFLLNGESLSDVSSKCGYDNVSSFSRAFKDFHGFSPTETSNKQKIKTFTKAGVDFSIRGALEIDYQIIELDDFYVTGIKGESVISDTECCERVWQKFNDSKIQKECLDNNFEVYATYKNLNNSVLCTIGKLSKVEHGDCEFLPKSKWVCFTLDRTDDPFVNSFYKNVLYSWFESTNYTKRQEMPNLEIYPADMSGDFVWKICIPIE